LAATTARMRRCIDKTSRETNIADEMREEHRRRVLGDRPGRREAACGNWRDRDAPPQQSLMAIRNEFVVSNAIRRDKAKNPILWAGTGTLIIVLRQVPDNCLTNDHSPSMGTQY